MERNSMYILFGHTIYNGNRHMLVVDLEVARSTVTVERL